jgi:hypothetical protein
VASLPRTAGQLGAQNLQLHAGPICPAQQAVVESMLTMHEHAGGAR